MMVSMETYLLRMKRKTDRLMEVPGLRMAGQGILHLGGGMLLSTLRIWGQMQPAAIALTLNSSGWNSCAAAAGSALGYRLFWGEDGFRGAVWVMGALLLTLLLPMMGNRVRFHLRMAAFAACMVSGTELAFQMLGKGTQTDVFLVRVVTAAGCGMVGGLGERMLQRIGLSLGVMALSGLAPWAGQFAVGVSAASFPLPDALLAGIGADLGNPGGIPMTAVVGLAFFLRHLPMQKTRSRCLSPGAACGLWMVIQRIWLPGMLLPICAGGAAGALIPWQLRPALRQSGAGAVQVKLEQAARMMNLFQRQLLEYAAPAPDVQAVADRLRGQTCDSCSARDGCLEQRRVNVALLESEDEFTCRKSAVSSAVLRYSREQLRRMKAARAAREEYRMAVVQQYGFLADALHRLSDRVAERNERLPARFRVQVSSRSRGRETADGDRVTAFPGLGCRYYVVLCDGMGTGLGAAEESRQTAEMIRQMLTAGLPPESVLGSVNSQLALLDRGGAVTVDLAELRLDTGKVWIYKWGAGPSLLLHRKQASQVGTSGPPPGLGVHVSGENVSHAGLGRGEVLVMASDGVRIDRAGEWAMLAPELPPGELASRILDDSPGQDDATAVVIRLLRKAECV